MNSELFADRLKMAMGEESNSGFAKKCGLSESAIRNYLKGQTTPDLGTLRKISDVSGFSLAWLASGVGEKKRGEEALEALGAMFDEEKDTYRALLLTVLEAVEEAQKIGWYDLTLMAPKERSALIYTLYVLFSDDQFKPLANKEFIAGQAVFVYMLIRDYESFTKKVSNPEFNTEVRGISEEMNLLGRAVEILGGMLSDADDKVPTAT